MKLHYGIIELGPIENVGEKASEIDLIKAQFVHYPDCQQLTIWLPQYGRQGYGHIRLIDNKTKTVVDDKPVTDRLNGSVQILWDTLNIPPNDYTIEIEHPKGGKHILPFKKFAKTKDVKQKKPLYLLQQQQKATFPSESSQTGLNTYKDGFGHTLPDEDLILKEKVTKELVDKFTRYVTYEGSFRTGYVIYVEEDLRIKFRHEMGGDNCAVYIEIPTENRWEEETKTPLSRRDEIMSFVANRAFSGRHEISDDCIYYYG
jgi:hypothetical protein